MLQDLRTHVSAPLLAMVVTAWPTSVLAKVAAPTDVPLRSEVLLAEGEGDVTVSERNVTADERNVTTGERNVTAREESTVASEQSTGTSEENAGTSEENAVASEENAGASEENARTSEEHAVASEQSTASSERGLRPGGQGDEVGIDPTDRAPRYPYPRLDPLGLGLTIGGSMVLATGLGVSAGWWTIRSQARANADARGEAYAEGTKTRRDYLARTDAVARGYLVAGSILVGVGLGTTIGGAVHLVVHRRRAQARPMAVHFVPLGSRTMAGLAVRGRF